MAGITTNITLTNNFTSTVVIPELNSNESTIQNLITEVNIPGLESVTPTPSLATTTITTELKTASDEPTSDTTPGKFVRGLDEILASIDYYKDILKVFAEQQPIPDAIQFAIDSIKFETAEIISNIYFTTERPAIDSISITDNRIITADKLVPETLLTQSSKYFSATKLLLDTGLILETRLPEFTKVLADAITISGVESILRTPTKDITDSILVVDDYKIFNLELVKQDISITSDSFISSIEYTRAFSETILSAETRAITLSVFTQDSVTTSAIDQFSKTATFDRSFEDMVVGTDDYYGAATLDDDEYATFVKVLAYTLITSEYKYYDSTKLLIDQTDILTPNYKLLNKPLADAIVTSITIDTLLTITKLLDDTFAVNDSRYFNISLGNIENLFIGETFNKLANYIRNYSDIIDIVDTKSLAIDLTKQDSVNLSSGDTFSKISEVYRSFEDSIVITDDYYGAATLDDDEYADFGKVLTDTLFIGEYRYYDSTKLLTDQTYILDPNYKTSSKTLADTISISSIEAILRGPSKLLEDTSTLTDSKYFDSNLVKQDSLSIADTFNRLANYIRSYSDITNTVDIKILTIELAKQDTVDLSSTDAFTKTSGVFRSFQDSITATDDYYGAATLDDDEYASVGKAITDVLFIAESRYHDSTKLLVDQDYITDTNDKTPGKILIETVSISSAETLLQSSGKLLLDTTTINETIATSSSLIKQDSNVISELINKLINYSRNYTENIALAELTILAPNLQKFDTVFFADVLTYVKSTGGTIFTDSIISTDSGIINTQNYFASSYVTPGYAGTNVTFGI